MFCQSLSELFQLHPFLTSQPERLSPVSESDLQTPDQPAPLAANCLNLILRKSPVYTINLPQRYNVSSNDNHYSYFRYKFGYKRKVKNRSIRLKQILPFNRKDKLTFSIDASLSPFYASIYSRHVQKPTFLIHVWLFSRPSFL